MRPRNHSNKLPQLVTIGAVVVVCLTAVASESFASNSSKIFLRQNFSTNHRDNLVAKLRKITGLGQLRFEGDGSLTIGTEANQRGSEIARILLTRAVMGRDIIIFEDASSRADIAFCRVVPGQQIRTNEEKLNTHVVLIDFTDFEKLIGDKKARESFDVGWGVLHELDHVVSDTEDGNLEDLLGACEKNINDMRQELGLPLRADYFYRPTLVRTNPNFRTNFVSLSFEQRDAKTGKLRTFLLTWDSEVVGGITTDSTTASLHPRN